jgi:hypothetical protein
MQPVYNEQYGCDMFWILTIDSGSSFSNFDPNSGSFAGNIVKRGNNSAGSTIRSRNVL